MAVTKGPIPQRSDQTVRRNLPETPIEKITEIGIVPIPELGIENPHPLIQDLYESLKKSAQRRFYEPSDWAYARFTLHLANEMLTNTGGKPISSMKISAVDSMLTKLLMTEGDRRRVRIEVERQQGGAPATVTQIADVYRERLQKQG